jgi:hypothetical protein
VLPKRIAPTVIPAIECEDSAEASFAGIHESILNVVGLDETLDAIRRCYASLWTPRAVAYRLGMDRRAGRSWAA